LYDCYICCCCRRSIKLYSLRNSPNGWQQRQQQLHQQQQQQWDWFFLGMIRRRRRRCPRACVRIYVRMYNCAGECCYYFFFFFFFLLTSGTDYTECVLYLPGAAFTKYFHNSSTIFLRLFYDFSPPAFPGFSAQNPSQPQ
jgi:hypothetical protein